MHAKVIAMNDAHVKEKVFTVLMNELDIPAQSLNLTLSFNDVESWDSINHLKLVLSLEQEFSTTFSDEDILNMMTVKGILDTVMSKTILHQVQCQDECR